MEAPTSGGLLRVVGPDGLAEEDAARAEATEPQETAFESELVSHIKGRFFEARSHRESEGIDDQLISALRAIRGQYDPDKLRAINQFQGSKVYARLTAAKCRGASALLRDIYLSSERPWGLKPTPKPAIPDTVEADIAQLVVTETQTLAQQGIPVTEDMMRERMRQLHDAARTAAKKTAAEETKEAEAALDDMLHEGGFYYALRDFLIDLPTFPYACIKGPTFRMTRSLKWQDGQITSVEQPRMFWDRISPFDLWFSPGATDLNDSEIMERVPMTRDELMALIGLPGYKEDAIRAVLRNHSMSGLSDWRTHFESERAGLEHREDRLDPEAGPYLDLLEYHGSVPGQWLIDWDYEDEYGESVDPDKEYFITAWVIDRWAIKVIINDSLRQRPPYYVTSYEKVPGSLYGNGLPVILADIQEVANAALRSLVNNLSIASGPQVVVNDDRAAPNADTDSLYPWKRWHVVDDPYGNAGQPVIFFQPNSNANELLQVYKEFTNMADEISAIPRYLTGSQRTGGAAATASGLAMLMNNASKVMQQVASNIDTDVIEPMLQELYDRVLLIDMGQTLRGDEEVVVRGVTTAIQREQDRVRQLEFLQNTNNPLDMQIIGPQGRANVLRAVASGLGLDGEKVVPSDEELAQMMQSAPPMGAVPPQGSPEAPAEGGPPHLNTQSNGRQTSGK